MSPAAANVPMENNPMKKGLSPKDALALIDDVYENTSSESSTEQSLGSDSGKKGLTRNNSTPGLAFNTKSAAATANFMHLMTKPRGRRKSAAVRTLSESDHNPKQNANFQWKSPSSKSPKTTLSPLMFKKRGSWNEQLFSTKLPSLQQSTEHSHDSQEPPPDDDDSMDASLPAHLLTLHNHTPDSPRKKRSSISSFQQSLRSLSDHTTRSRRHSFMDHPQKRNSGRQDSSSSSIGASYMDMLGSSMRGISAAGPVHNSGMDYTTILKQRKNYQMTGNTSGIIVDTAKDEMIQELRDALAQKETTVNYLRRELRSQIMETAQEEFDENNEEEDKDDLGGSTGSDDMDENGELRDSMKDLMARPSFSPHEVFLPSGWTVDEPAYLSEMEQKLDYALQEKKKTEEQKQERDRQIEHLQQTMEREREEAQKTIAAGEKKLEAAKRQAQRTLDRRLQGQEKRVKAKFEKELKEQEEWFHERADEAYDMLEKLHAQDLTEKMAEANKRIAELEAREGKEPKELERQLQQSKLRVQELEAKLKPQQNGKAARRKPEPEDPEEEPTQKPRSRIEELRAKVRKQQNGLRKKFAESIS